MNGPSCRMQAKTINAENRFALWAGQQYSGLFVSRFLIYFSCKQDFAQIAQSQICLAILAEFILSIAL
jgi:hypothetical protein